MKRMRHSILTYLCIGICIICLSSCKKKDNDTKSMSFQGHMEIEGDIPSFVNPGDVLKISTSGLRASYSDTEVPNIRYSYRVSPQQSKRDTCDTFNYVFPDELGTSTLSIYGFALGYTTVTLEYTIKTVSPTESLTGQDFDPEGKTFTDVRDSRKYHYTSIAGLDWMSQNLAYCGYGKAYKSTKDSGYDAMTDIYGMYYTWDEAMKACPEGWRLPTEDDWTAMCQTVSDDTLTPYATYSGIAGKLMSNARLNGDKLWEYFTIMNINPTATFFNALPCGFANIAGDYYLFDSTDSYASFWTASEFDEEQAWCRYIANNGDYADILAQPLYKKDVAMPIRCVRNSE